MAAIKAGTVGGIEVRISPAFLPCAVLWAAAGELRVLLTLLPALLLHEACHVAVGRLLGAETLSVTLHPFGAGARMCDAETPSRELLIALAGPAGSLLLAFLWEEARGFLPPWPDWPRFNRSIGLINCLPVFPLDGGRVLHALAQTLFGEKGGKAVKAAGLPLSGALLAYSLFRVIRFHDGGTVVMGAFLFSAALSARREAPSLFRRPRFREKAETVRWLRAKENETLRHVLSRCSGAYYYMIVLPEKRQTLSETEAYDALTRDGAQTVGEALRRKATSVSNSSSV